MLESVGKKTRPGTIDLYDIFCGVLYVLKSGCQNLAVDTQGLHHAIPITTANITDRKGAMEACSLNRNFLSDVKNRLGDGGYFGENFSNSIQEILGCRVVERSFAWPEKCRRLWKNCERKLNTSLNTVF